MESSETWKRANGLAATTGPGTAFVDNAQQRGEC